MDPDFERLLAAVSNLAALEKADRRKFRGERKEKQHAVAVLYVEWRGLIDPLTWIDFCAYYRFYGQSADPSDEELFKALDILLLKAYPPLFPGDSKRDHMSRRRNRVRQAFKELCALSTPPQLEHVFSLLSQPGGIARRATEYAARRRLERAGRAAASTMNAAPTAPSASHSQNQKVAENRNDAVVIVRGGQTTTPVLKPKSRQQPMAKRSRVVDLLLRPNVRLVPGTRYRIDAVATQTKGGTEVTVRATDVRALRARSASKRQLGSIIVERVR